ncbi:helix-turn-helix domain-containing protein [Chromobacterium phragmitis]|uniref:HTH cro/C1-type domain-containing protein n=1 Tax=Chromobacterium phragmitis TaxID=2202141 RepID=A0ABV0J0Q4_9NEIS
MSIGRRLKEERERLGFTQPAFAGLAETTKKSQIDYEKDATQPKAGYLAAIAEAGADVQYIVTGVHTNRALSGDEQELLALFRAATAEVQATIMAGLKGGVCLSSGAGRQNQRGDDDQRSA